LGIKTNARALTNDSSDGLLQGSLNSVVNREPRRPPFTTRGLIDHIVELIVCEDEVRVVLLILCLTDIILGVPTD
jgi:hypothetical protein